jgi:hypothetical protein
MISQAVVNLIAHEIQVAEGIHLSEKSREHIARLLYDTLAKETEQCRKEKEYWRELALKHYRR